MKRKGIEIKKKYGPLLVLFLKKDNPFKLDELKNILENINTLDLNEKENKTGNTPLILACKDIKDNSTEIVEILLEQKGILKV